MPQPPGSSSEQRWWKAISQLQVPERIRCFIWLLAQGRISLNEQKRKRHLTQDESCYRCPSQAKSRLHIFRDCPPTAYLWNRLTRTDSQYEFFSCQWDVWLKRNIMNEEASVADLPWQVFFSVALWCIWKNKNEGTFNGISKSLSAPSLLQTIRIKAEMWFRAWNAPRLTVGRTNPLPMRINAEIGWKAPPSGWRKLNVDGAANQNLGIAGAGGVLGDDSSTWIGGFVSSLGSCTATMAELWAIYHGL
ncbi:unnamed protein product [Linum trigynum]|uniref:RNase H type-1 domain-containing protein n=1 Tax=Linum trigynum TaxID=586398 RepID=A0AAV2CWK6_9ROSI